MQPVMTVGGDVHRLIRSDIAAARRHRSGETWWAIYPQITAAVLYRLAHATAAAHRKRARAITAINLLLTGADIDDLADIGEGLYMQHPNGVVIGPARIGARFTCGPCIVIGGKAAKGRDGFDAFPSIGDDVTVHAHASVLGPYVVGDGTVVGAHALVMSDTSLGAVMVGVPARPIQPPPPG